MHKRLIQRILKLRRDERGVQLVELAIILPVVVVLFAATAEFGRYFYEYTTLAKASRVAVRYLVTARTNGDDDDGAKNLVIYGNFAGTGSKVVYGLDTANVVITRRNAAGVVVTGGVPYTVTVEIVNFKHSSLFNLAGLTNSSATLNIDIKPSVTMHYLLTQPSI